MMLRVALLLVSIVIVACGPFGVGLGVSELLDDGPNQDLTNPSVLFFDKALYYTCLGYADPDNDRP